MVTVMNLATQEKKIYSCSPREAVVACYAQSFGDYNTWDYTKHYDHLVEEGAITWLCGDFCAYKDGREF